MPIFQLENPPVGPPPASAAAPDAAAIALGVPLARQAVHFRIVVLHFLHQYCPNATRLKRVMPDLLPSPVLCITFFRIQLGKPFPADR